MSESFLESGNKKTYVRIKHGCLFIQPFSITGGGNEQMEWSESS